MDEIEIQELRVVVLACNPSYLGGRGRKITVWGQPGQI
jgi:hypothetical protein